MAWKRSVCGLRIEVDNSLTSRNIVESIANEICNEDVFEYEDFVREYYSGDKIEYFLDIQWFDYVYEGDIVEMIKERFDKELGIEVCINVEYSVFN